MPLSPQCATPPQCALTFSRSCLHLNSQLSSKRPVWRGPPLFRDSSPLREVTGAVGESRVIASWCSYNPQDRARITNTLCRKWEELGIYYLPEIAKWHSFPRDFGHVPHWCHRHICIWWDSHTVQICFKKNTQVPYIVKVLEPLFVSEVCVLSKWLHLSWQTTARRVAR